VRVCGVCVCVCVCVWCVWGVCVWCVGACVGGGVVWVCGVLLALYSVLNAKE